MILVDYKKGGEKKGQDTPQEFVNLLRRLGLRSEKADLPYGDFCFEGKGPDGPIFIGIERKTLHDLNACIEDARFSSHQRLGMKEMYTLSVLLVEGNWRPHDPSGLLMEGFSGGTAWAMFKSIANGRRVMFSKFSRYLISQQMAGVIVIYARDVFGSAYLIHDWFHYWQKREHDSLLQHQKVSLPSLLSKPNLVRRWAHALEDIGPKLTELAARQFRTPLKLATADEIAWASIPGIGVPTARKIFREIHGL